MKAAVTTLLECLGEDVSREGLLDTPRRVAHSLEFLTRGSLASPNGPILPCLPAAYSRPLGSPVFSEAACVFVGGGLGLERGWPGNIAVHSFISRLPEAPRCHSGPRSWALM
jgi:hypothetical protein